MKIKPVFHGDELIVLSYKNGICQKKKSCALAKFKDLWNFSVQDWSLDFDFVNT